MVSAGIAGLTTVTASGLITGGSLTVSGAIGGATTVSATGLVTAGSLQVNGAATITGSITAASANAAIKAFDIRHPDPSKPSMRLRHRCLEGEDHGTYYKSTVTCHEGLNVVDLPSYFQFLNGEASVFVSPLRHFGAAWGEVVGNTLNVMTNCSGDFNVLVMCVRKDPDAVSDTIGVEYTPVGV